MLNLISFLLTDCAIDLGIKYLDKLIRPPLTTIYSEEIFLSKPILLPSVEYTDLLIKSDQSENGLVLSSLLLTIHRYSAVRQLVCLFIGSSTQSPNNSEFILLK